MQMMVFLPLPWLMKQFPHWTLLRLLFEEERRLGVCVNVCMYATNDDNNDNGISHPHGFWTIWVNGRAVYSGVPLWCMAMWWMNMYMDFSKLLLWLYNGPIGLCLILMCILLLCNNVHVVDAIEAEFRVTLKSRPFAFPFTDSTYV